MTSLLINVFILSSCTIVPEIRSPTILKSRQNMIEDSENKSVLREVVSVTFYIAVQGILAALEDLRTRKDRSFYS